MENKLISIIVPVYNAEKTLDRCVNSLLSQTYQNIEIILVNDGSKDKSLEICHSFCGDKIKVIDKENGGVSSARNAGLKLANGYYVVFVDSDDSLDNNHIEKIIQLKEENNVEMVVCGIKIITNTNRLILFDNEGIFSLVKNQELFKQKNFYGLISSPCNKLYVRSKIKQGFPEKISNGEDAFFNFKYLTDCQNILITNQLTYNYYYENSNSLTKKFSEKRFEDSLLIFEEYENFLKLKDSYDEKIINRCLLREVCSIAKSLVRNNNINRRCKYKKLQQYLNHEKINLATKKYSAYGFAEKCSFVLLKLKLHRLFYLCCKIFS